MRNIHNHSALWLAYPNNLYVQIFKPFWTLLPCLNWHFFHFFVWGSYSQIFHILLILTGKMHWNGLSCAYLGFEVCWIQWHRFQVSMISGSWKIKIWGKNFTFCWFWLGKMHQNGLSGMYLGFKVFWIQWNLFQVSKTSSSWKIKIFRDK